MSNKLNEVDVSYVNDTTGNYKNVLRLGYSTTGDGMILRLVFKEELNKFTRQIEPTEYVDINMHQVLNVAVLPQQ